MLSTWPLITVIVSPCFWLFAGRWNFRIIARSSMLVGSTQAGTAPSLIWSQLEGCAVSPDSSQTVRTLAFNSAFPLQKDRIWETLCSWQWTWFSVLALRLGYFVGPDSQCLRSSSWSSGSRPGLHYLHSSLSSEPYYFLEPADACLCTLTQNYSFLAPVQDGPWMQRTGGNFWLTKSCLKFGCLHGSVVDGVQAPQGIAQFRFCAGSTSLSLPV